MHDLHVIDVEEHLHALGADALENLDRPVHVVAEIIGVPLHLDVHARVEHFERERDFLLLRVAGDLLEAVHHVFHAFLVAELAPKSRECDHRREARRGRGVDALGENLDALGVFLDVREALRKAVAARERADQPVLFEHRELVRPDQLDGLEAHLHGVRREVLDGHRPEAPRDDGLVDAPVLCLVGAGLSAAKEGRCSGRSGCGERATAQDRPAAEAGTARRRRSAGFHVGMGKLF